MAYIWRAKYTFPYSGSILNGIVRYVIARLLGYVSNIGMLYLFSDRLGYPHQLVQAIAILVMVAILFLLFPYFVFTKSTVASVGFL